jgi:hypothetical protein
MEASQELAPPAEDEARVLDDFVGQARYVGLQQIERPRSPLLQAGR